MDNKLTDKDFLIWIHSRLNKEYKEPVMSSHLCKLRGIIAAMCHETCSPYVNSEDIS